MIIDHLRPFTISNLLDCKSVFDSGATTSGVYEMKLPGYPPFDAWCEFDYGFGWTVIQRRQDGSLDFNLNWQGYKDGFGDLAGEHWLGNDKIHELTNKFDYALRIEMESFDGSIRTVVYDKFTISDEADGYRMTAIGYSGPSDGDNLGYQSGMQFSTRDRDNDMLLNSFIAVDTESGWWFRNLVLANLNGRYFPHGIAYDAYGGIRWPSSWQMDPAHSFIRTVMFLARA